MATRKTPRDAERPWYESASMRWMGKTAALLLVCLGRLAVPVGALADTPFGGNPAGAIIPGLI
jgi:hypothetical protein